MAQPIESIRFAGPPDLIQRGPNPSRAVSPGVQFADALLEAMEPPAKVSFSAHAQQRLDDRGITIEPADAARLGRAVDDAAQKGARESLLIMDRTALVVSVPNRTVITVMEPDSASNTVITQIDSVVVVGE